MTSLNPLLPAAIVLLIAGLAIPGAFLAGLAEAGLWFAHAVFELVFDRDGAAILTAALIGTAVAAWLIL